MTERWYPQPADRTAENREQEFWQKPVTTLKGISQSRAKLLAQLDVYNFRDLLRLFPRDYHDWSQLTPLSELREGEEATILAVCTTEPNLRYRGARSTLRVTFRDATGGIVCLWFNSPFFADKLIKGQLYLLRGRVRSYGQQNQMVNPQFQPQDQILLAGESLSVPPEGVNYREIGPENLAVSFVRPIYPLVAGLQQGNVRNWVETVLDWALDRHYLREVLPAPLRRRQRLSTGEYALTRIHRPETLEAYSIARHRLVFEELFFTVLGLLRLGRRARDEFAAFPVRLGAADDKLWRDTVSRLPFSLTGAQSRCCDEIAADLAAERPMNRLLQGDVGSGKTVIAALAVLRAKLAGGQSVLMAPTTVLAGQHYSTLINMPGLDSLRVALLTGSTRAAERRNILAALAAGEIDLLVGTHAVLTEDVVFANLVLAITDEQHRFGVRQRIGLFSGEKSSPHVLVMSATPIPRSLALVLYGDLDVSVVDELPAGRQTIATYTARSADWPRVLGLVRKRVELGQQVYVICPLKYADETDDDEKISHDVKADSPVELVNSAAEAVFEWLQKEALPDLRSGLLHGGMKDREKNAALMSFRAGETQILVATTVVEVGVDNPNATLMLILGAERFGLSQLHQLRGRIGRGSEASVCVLMSDTDRELARERFKVLCRSNDGFYLAEQDLRLRGPGDLFGVRQHGIPEFRLANLYTDQDLLRAATAEARQIMSADPDLTLPENSQLLRGLDAAFGERLTHIGL